MAHNPEVEGSNPSPATKARGPLSNRKRASCSSFVNRFCKRLARSGCLAACASTVVPWSSHAEPVISNEVSDPLIRRLRNDCLRPACCRIFLSSTKYQGGSAPRRRTAPPAAGSGLGKPRPARARLRGLRAALIRQASANRGLGSAAVFLAPDFPSRGCRVKGALRASLTRSASPTLDPAAAHQGSAAMRKMGGHQETAYGAGGCDGIKIGQGRPGGAGPLAQLACFPRGAVRPWF
jgi:hypothetical protein